MDKRITLVLKDVYGRETFINGLDGLEESLSQREVKMTYYYCYQAILTPATCVITIHQPTDIERGAIETAVEATLYYQDGNQQKLFWGDVLYYDSLVNDAGFPYISLFLAQHDAFYHKQVSYSSSGATNLEELVKTLLRVCQSPVELGYISKTLGQKAFIDGYVAHGKLTDEIANLLSGEDATVYLQDGFLYILGKETISKKQRVEEENILGLTHPNDVGLMVKTKPGWYQIGADYQLDSSGGRGEYIGIKAEGWGGNTQSGAYSMITLADRDRIQAGDFLFWG